MNLLPLFIYWSYFLKLQRVESRLHVSKNYENEVASGVWDYLDNNDNERARHAIIGGVFMRHASRNASVLDIGCGFGTLSDFLSSAHASNYLGIDLSSSEIEKGKSKRPKIKLKAADANKFTPHRQFDVIVFNEMLYYFDVKQIMFRYINYLTKPGGFMVVSVFKYLDKIKGDSQTEILNIIQSVFTVLNRIEIRAETPEGHASWVLLMLKPTENNQTIITS